MIPRNNGASVRHRTILATFGDPSHVYDIMNSVVRLKGTPFGVSRDYPREISDARRELWPEYKQARAQYGPRAVKLAYPAALVVNGDVVRDLFPGWFDVMRGSRNTDSRARIQSRYNHLRSDATSKSTKQARESPRPPSQSIVEESDDSDMDVVVEVEVGHSNQNGGASDNSEQNSNHQNHVRSDRRSGGSEPSVVRRQSARKLTQDTGAVLENREPTTDPAAPGAADPNAVNDNSENSESDSDGV